MVFDKGKYKINASIKNWKFRFLNAIIKRQGYQLMRQAPVNGIETIIDNFFKTTHQKNALLSYIIYPFLGEIENNHSNNRECFCIAEILNELGFNVDVINWNDTSFIPIKKYELVIDNHNNLARLSSYFKANTLKIFHATNAYWLYQNQLEYKRSYDFFLSTGVTLTPPRLISQGNSAQYADAIAMFGNEFTKSTYGKYASKVNHLPMSVTTTPEIITERNYLLAKTKFVWLNSHGALLKGLDVVIDAFTLLPELTLYVCGNMERDSQFLETVASQLSQASNIKFAGWVELDSDEFKKIVTDCAWIINTSFSEGGGGSTLNCMAKGLIPVLSKSSSISLPDQTGFYIKHNNAENLSNLLQTISILPDEALKELSNNAVDFIGTNHTVENFKKKYKNFLIAVTNDNNN